MIPRIEQSILDYLVAVTESAGARPALTFESENRLTYAQVVEQITHVVGDLNRLGIGRGDRIALVLADGSKTAVAFLGVAAGAVCAPLNPNLRAQEFTSIFAALGPKAVIVETHDEGAAVAAAKALSLPLFRLAVARSDGSSTYSIGGAPLAEPALTGFASAADVALMLFTSGTTARPKLVPLTHANLLASARNIAATLQLTHNDRCLNIMPLFHIHGLIGGLLATLVSGGNVNCPGGFNVNEFFTWMATFDPTWYTAVPTMHQAILARACANAETIRANSLRFIRSSSSALPTRVMEELETAFDAPVIEAYGMTEASHQMASNPLPPELRKPGSVGKAAGPEIAIMDDDGRLQPARAVGEVVIRGANVMLGYLDNREANATAFCAGWFRTGDQGYLDDDGYLFLTGRIKELINRAGEKISPREIDDVLMRHPAVEQAVTFAVAHSLLGEEVAAAVVLRPYMDVSKRQLLEFAAAQLADFKVPRQIVIVDAIPKGPTGKLQRNGLADTLGVTAADLADAGGAAPFEAAETEVEKKIASLCKRILKVETIGRRENLFHLGADSILAGQIVARFPAAVGSTITLIDLFEAPTVAGLATIAEAKTRPRSQDEAPLGRVPRQGTLPLSFIQEAVWFHHQLDPEATLYNRSVAFRGSGPLNIAALQRSLQEVVGRHEALRTTFSSVAGQPVQEIHPAPTIELANLDWKSFSPAEKEAGVYRFAVAEAQRPFDLNKGPLLRATVITLDDHDHLLFVVFHHIVTDGWSNEIFFNEWGQFYSALIKDSAPTLPDCPIQYADYAHWQRNQLNGERLETELKYWRGQLAGELPLLELPTDRSRLTPERKPAGISQRLILPKRIGDGLYALCRQENVTPFMVLLAAFNVLLHRYSGQDDILVGAPTAGRMRQETEGLVGNFLNMLVLRSDLRGNPTFRSLLGRVREVTLQAYAHQELPLTRLVQELIFDRSDPIPAPFRVSLQLRNLPARPMEFAGLQLSPFPFDDGIAQFEVGVVVQETRAGFDCAFTYDASLFEASTMARMTRHFENLIGGIVANPNLSIAHLPLLDEDEKYRLCVEANATEKFYPAVACVQDLIAAQVERTPDAPAVVCEGQQLSYRELNRRANQLAHSLRGRGVTREALVPVCIERSIDMMVGLLAVLKAGAAYVPLDPNAPQERLAMTLADMPHAVILTQARLERLFLNHRGAKICLDTGWTTIAQERDENPQHQAILDDLAYVIFTSGSTGKPKGVMVTHRGLTNYLNYCITAYPLTAGRGALVHSTIAFDATITGLYAPLLVGGTVYLVPQGDELEGLSRTLLEVGGFSLVKITPAHLALLAQQIPPEKARGLTHAFVIGGENLTADQIAFWQQHAPETELYNEYGPTETVVGCIVFQANQWRGRGSVPIGQAIPNTTAYVLDGHGQPVPLGVVGELYLGGTGVARGYLNNRELTESKFVTDLFSQRQNERLYRTGDLVRRLSDGNYEFIGRIDDQVKIRGFRIELAEIESALAQFDGVRENVVLVRGQNALDKQLVAYLVTADKAKPSVAALRQFLEGKLPEYMVPATFVFVDQLPLTFNGKVDRKALLAAKIDQPSKGASHLAPRNALEKKLASIWGQILKLKEVGIHDNFFELGGHSLLAVRLRAEMEKQLGRNLPLAMLFKAPTIAQLAEKISHADEVKASAVIAVQPHGIKAPFFCVHGYNAYRAIAGALGRDRPFYGLGQHFSGLRVWRTRVEDQAKAHLNEIYAIQPTGPYYLAGHSVGGMIAYEIALLLRAAGHEIAFLGLIDTVEPSQSRAVAREFRLTVGRWRSLVGQATATGHFDQLIDQIKVSAEYHLKALICFGYHLIDKPLPPELLNFYVDEIVFDRKYSREQRRYRPRPYDGRVDYFKAAQGFHEIEYWRTLTNDQLVVHEIPGTHLTMIEDTGATQLAHCLKSCLDSATVDQQPVAIPNPHARSNRAGRPPYQAGAKRDNEQSATRLVD